jgi:hypothetical protein
VTGVGVVVRVFVVQEVAADVLGAAVDDNRREAVRVDADVVEEDVRRERAHFGERIDPPENPPMNRTALTPA